jgi:hypothetical protein
LKRPYKRSFLIQMALDITKKDIDEAGPSSENKKKFPGNVDILKHQCKFCWKSFKTCQGLKIHCSKIHQIKETLPFKKHSQNSEEKIYTNVFQENYLSNLKSKIPVLKRVPKAARPLISNELTNVINDVVEKNTDVTWYKLFLFTYAVLQLPQKKNKSKNLTTFVKENLNAWKIIKQADFNEIYNHIMEHFVDKKQRKIIKKFKENVSQLCQKAQTKLSDGDIRGALNMLTSQDMIVPRNEATMQALQKKHPPPRKYNSTTVFQQKLDNNMSSVTSLEVTKAIASFPNGSAGGLDAIRPQNFKDLKSDVLGQNNEFNEFTNLGTLLLNGEVPSSICPILYGANLCALKKKDGGIRPIAVGSTIRRLISKIVCRRITDKLGSKFRPHQLGFGTKGGIEAAKHSARRYLQYPHQSTKVLLKIDFLNAFNMLDRENNFEEKLMKKFQNSIIFLNQCYQKPSNLYYGSTVILSQRGVQQGDPLGPPLFCLGIQSMIM